MAKIKLVTSKFSPYCYRVEMALIEKNLPYEKEVIDLQNRPEQFAKDSPLGKVPLIYIDDKILFESVVICEYLEELFPENPLQPQDAYSKAWHRAWMEFSNGILATSFGVIWAQNQEEFDLKKAELISKLAILDKQLKSTPYFDGEKFSLLDICLASVFKPLAFIDRQFALGILDSNQNVATYALSIVARESLNKALPADYEELFKSYLERKKSHLLTMSLSL